MGQVDEIFTEFSYHKIERHYYYNTRTEIWSLIYVSSWLLQKEFIQAVAGRYSSYVCENDVGNEEDGDAVNMSDRWPWLEEFFPGLSAG